MHQRGCSSITLSVVLTLFSANCEFVSEDELDAETLEDDSQSIRVNGVEVPIPFPIFGRYLNNRRVEWPLGLSGPKIPANDNLDPYLAELGNLLYFDRRLSKGNRISCSTCHDPAAGYSATNFVKGVDGNQLHRTASVGTNRLWGTRNGWAGERTLEQQSSSPITSASEMGLTRSQLLSVVRANIGYVDRLQRLVNAGVISAPAVSVKNIELALATFQRLLMTGNSPVDRFEAGDPNALTAQQKRGRQLFHNQARCAVCHNGPNYSDEKFHFIVPGQQADRGRQDVTNRQSDFGKFKTPSLRNAALRKPYFHNGDPLHGSGLALTLREVVRRYNNGASTGGSPLVVRLNMSGAQQADVAEFVGALTGDVPLDPWLSRTGFATTGWQRDSIYFSPAIFNDVEYRNRYPDLRRFSLDWVRRHWVRAGMREGRIGVRTFAVKEYIQLHREVFNSVSGTSDPHREAIEHYLNVGHRKGLSGRYVLDRGFFHLQHYRQLNGRDTALRPEKDALDHYLTAGLNLKQPSHLKPRGYFIVTGSGARTYHYANGVASCRFASRNAQRANRGVSDDVGVPRLPRIPTNLKNGGNCRVSSSPPTMSTPRTADPGRLVSFSCQHQGNNSVCRKTAQCPSGEKIRAIRAACNLELGNVTTTHVKNLRWNQLRVLRASDVITQGRCRVGGMEINFGKVGLLPPDQTPGEIRVECKEHDGNGGECHIRGEMICSR